MLFNKGNIVVALLGKWQKVSTRSFMALVLRESMDRVKGGRI
jgi:hypothetical protein